MFVYLLVNEATNESGDGFRHFGHQKSGMFYNGTKLEDIQADNSTVLGVGGMFILCLFLHLTNRSMGGQGDSWARRSTRLSRVGRQKRRLLRSIQTTSHPLEAFTGRVG
jgi:hypothetical protein